MEVISTSTVIAAAISRKREREREKQQLYRLVFTLALIRGCSTAFPLKTDIAGKRCSYQHYLFIILHLHLGNWGGIKQL